MTGEAETQEQDDSITPEEKLEIDQMLMRDRVVDNLQAIFFPDKTYVLGNNHAKLYRAIDAMQPLIERASLDARIKDARNLEHDTGWLDRDASIVMFRKVRKHTAELEKERNLLT